MNAPETLAKYGTALKNDDSFFKEQQKQIAKSFQDECQRFRMIKGSTELTVAELDTIALNSAKNVLNSFANR